MKDYTTIEKWDDDWNGSAIYSLIDQNGKRYIGQAISLQARLENHRVFLNKAYKDKDAIVSEGSKLVDAVRGGARFRVEVLKKIRWCESTVNNLRYWESYYLEKFGGVKSTYNSAPIPDPVWNNESNNDVTLILRVENDILDRLEAEGNMQGYIKRLIREDIRKK